MENIENKELTAEEILERLRADVEQKKLELDKVNEEVWELQRQVHNHFYEKEDLRNFTTGDFFGSSIIGGLGAWGTWMVSMIYRAGGVFFRRIDYVKHYFNTHPEALKIAEETTGSTDLNYNAGFILGSDSAAEALFASCGYQDFIWNNLCASCVDAGIAFAAIVGGCFALNQVSSLYHGVKGKKCEKKLDQKREEKRTVCEEYMALKEELKAMEAKEQAKNAMIESKPQEAVQTF